MRWEVALRTTIRFFSQRTEPGEPADAAEPFAIAFEGREFVWHPAVDADPDRDSRLPTLTVMTEDARDYRAEMLATERLLSGLSYRYRGEVTVLNSAGVGWPEAFDPPVATAAGPGPAGIRHEAPAGLEVVADERLRLVVALHREAKSAGSPFYRFLSYWNAIEAAFDYDGRALDRFVEAAPDRSPGWFRGRDRPPEGWPAYFRDANGDAVARAVRDRTDGPIHDPDDPWDRWVLHRDARLLELLLRDGVDERWGRSAVRSVPRPVPEADSA